MCLWLNFCCQFPKRLHMLRAENSFFRKTRRNALVKQVREVYIRSDIPCLSSCCPLSPPCHEKVFTDSSLLAPDATHYLLPDFSVATKYLEILEQEELTGLIITQTILERLQQHEKSRTSRRLRQVIADPRRRSVLFNNENFSDTFLLRLPNESSKKRDWRALYKVAEWYRQHLQGVVPIVILSEQWKQSDIELSANSIGIIVCSIEEYLSKFWPGHRVLFELLDSLKNVESEDDDGDWLKFKPPGAEGAKRSGGTTGYMEYKLMEELEAGIKSGTFFRGILRVRASHTDQAYITGGERLGSEILIVGNQNRNRAVNGDLVVVELLPESTLTTPLNSMPYNLDEVKADEDEDIVTEGSGGRKPTGRVIGVISRNWRSYVATVQQDTTEQSGSFHLTIPLDQTIPKIRIRHHDIKSIANQRIVIRIDDWPVYSQYPNGHYVRSLGPIHALDTEISAILVEHGISVSQSSAEFSEASLKEMPKNTKTHPWKPDPEEIARRRDLRESRTIFSIDPPGSQDIDDALSIHDLEDGHVEFGVHIADVSYFVPENSVTDLEARARATTVYLADRRFNMLPPVLSEQVCSLRGQVDRFAVSVIWTLDASANIVSTWYGRTVIRSACEMEYGQAQALFDGEKNVDRLDRELGERLRPYIVKLVLLLRIIRERRLEKGALELESSAVTFSFTQDKQINDIDILEVAKLCLDAVSKQPLEIHGIVAEAMILANISVAERVHQTLRDCTLLRRHPIPSKSRFQALKKAAGIKGFTIDTSSNLSLALSLKNCANESHGDKDFVKLLKMMTVMAMSEAGYMSSGSYAPEQYYHYGLAVSFYTHFTSPIRRYADVIVHRQLLSVVSSRTYGNQHRTSLLFQNAKLAEISDHLNTKSHESKHAQRDSTELFQALYIKQKSRAGPITEVGVISELRANGFFVFVPRFGIRGPVYLKDKDGQLTIPASLISGDPRDGDSYLPNCRVQEETSTHITVYIPSAKRPLTFRQFDHVQVSLKLHESHAHRHVVYMILIALEQTESANAGRAVTRPKPNAALLDQKDMMRAVSLDEHSSISSNTLATNEQQFQQTPSAESFYELADRFEHLSIIEVSATMNT